MAASFAANSRATFVIFFSSFAVLDMQLGVVRRLLFGWRASSSSSKAAELLRRVLAPAGRRARPRAPPRPRPMMLFGAWLGVPLLERMFTVGVSSLARDALLEQGRVSAPGL